MSTRANEHTSTRTYEHTILFDADCNLCKASVRFIQKHDSKKRISFVPLNTPESRAALKKVGVDFILKNTVYFIHQNKPYIKSTAVLKALSMLRFPVNLLGVFLIVPRFIRDYFYGLVAKNRTRF